MFNVTFSCKNSPIVHVIINITLKSLSVVERSRMNQVIAQFEQLQLAAAKEDKKISFQ